MQSSLQVTSSGKERPLIEIPGNRWKLKHTISNYQIARGIAVDKKGNVAVTDTLQKKVLLYKAESRNAKPQTLIAPSMVTLNNVFEINECKLDPRDVCVTSHEQAVVIFEPSLYYNRFLAINYKGSQPEYAKFPSTLTTDSHCRSDPFCLTSECGVIYAGFEDRINVYNVNGFELVDTIKIITERPQFIACTKDRKNRKILV